MKIVTLIAENIKRLTAVEISPDGNLVQISGKNGAGKTSVLDSIWWALAGASHIQAAPIRNGADKARIRLDLGELVVTRTFSRQKDGDKFTTSLTVESADGAMFRSPQKVIDDLLGELSFDPLGFARAKPSDQIDMLKRLVPGVDFDAIEEQNEADYQKRRDVNRRAKELRAQAEGIEAPSEVPEPIDEAALVAKLEQAGEHNAEIERRKARREKVAQEAETLDIDADNHRAQANKFREMADEQDRLADETQARANDLRERLKKAEPLPGPIDTSSIRDRIAEARAFNRHVEEALRRQKLEAEAETLEQQSEALTRAMEDRDEAKAKAIAAAKLPVPGLVFGSGAVTLDGVPFDQGSDAEQLRASVAIAAALNPKLRVIRIRDGSLLDEDGLRLVAELAEQQDMQVWIERVDASGKVGFVIEDGTLAEAKAEDAA